MAIASIRLRCGFGCGYNLWFNWFNVPCRHDTIANRCIEVETSDYFINTARYQYWSLQINSIPSSVFDAIETDIILTHNNIDDCKYAKVFIKCSSQDQPLLIR